ncbi:hypothetical protein CBL_05315 [Carabus blaptoides fortunei]
MVIKVLKARNGRGKIASAMVRAAVELEGTLPQNAATHIWETTATEVAYMDGVLSVMTPNTHTHYIASKPLEHLNIATFFKTPEVLFSKRYTLEFRIFEIIELLIGLQ